jgi:dipeptidyl aminopeptidase/acylaminoacyl peptidase
MTRFDRVEPRLPDLLTQLAAPGLPDYTDDVLARTAGIRQRPRWTLLERWLPMGVLAQRSVYVPRAPWRAVIVAALLLVVVAATLAWVGSQRRVAPPFGPARNGLIMYTVGGDLLSWDPESGATRTLLEGATDDFTGMFSRDGTKLAFLRRERPPTEEAPELISIQVANADGTNPLNLTGPLDAPDQWDWSPAGDAIVVQSKIAGRPTLQVVPTDGSEPLRVLDTGMAVTWPSWLPPNGDEIVFRGVVDAPDGLRSGLFAVAPDGGKPRPLTATDGDSDDGYNEPVVSPDGTHVLYRTWDPVGMMMSLRLLDLRTGTDDALPRTGAQFGEGGGVFSPDGSLVAFHGHEEAGYRLYIAPVDGSAKPRVLTGITPGGSYVEFAPDGTKVMLNRFGSATLLIDVESGDAEALPGTVNDPGSWQRLAP